MGNDTAKLSPQVITDLTEKTTFTAEEIHHFYREFEKGCTPGHLGMTREEFKDMYRKWFPQGDPVPFAEHVFNQFEVDDKGCVRFRDVLAMLTVNLKGTMEQRLEWTFNLYDVGNTGSIEKAELFEIVKSMYQLKANALPAEEKATPKQISDFIMERCDVDKDGRIGKSEFVRSAVSSKTIQKLLVGTLAATSSPFMGRKRAGSKGRARTDSFGRPRSESTNSMDSPPSVPKSYNIKS